MKRLTFVVLALVAVFTISCKKEKNMPKNDEYYLSAVKDNFAWNSPSFNGQSAASNMLAGAPFRNSYYLITPDNEILVVANVGEEHLSVYFTSVSPNSYQLNKSKTIFNITIGQDAVSANYVLDESKTNTANITNVNVAKKAINGNFVLNFKKANGFESYPATIAFTNGKFYLTTSSN